MKEYYKPSREEVQKAENFLTPEQKEFSNERIELFQREVRIQSHTDEAFNNRNERIYEQIKVNNKI